MDKIVIATRGSALALWQAEHIRSLLQKKYDNLQIELSILKTKGDIILDVPLAKVGGKGLFVKEIEEALLVKKADIAVHSMKDVPMELPDGLTLAAIPEREVFCDVFLSEKYQTIDELPKRAIVGTSSLRRQAQILALRPDLQISLLRGNVETRIKKMQSGLYDAIILAKAGIKRLGLVAKYEQILEPPFFLPAVGQGALGIEIASERNDLKELLAFLNHKETQLCVLAERAFLRRLDGGCQVPIAAHATISGNKIILSGLVASVQGTKVIKKEATCNANIEDAELLGKTLAEDILECGAAQILSELYSE